MNNERQSGLYVPNDASEQLYKPPQEDLPSIVLYGGGAYGIGYKAGALDEIRDRIRQRGVDVSNAYVLGTSAGSWVGAMMATGVEYDDVADAPQVKLRNYEKDYLYGYAKEIFGEARAENVNASAFRLPTRMHPRPGLEILNGGDHDLAHLAAASSSVPGLWKPHNIGVKHYWDGAAGGSGGYADRAPKSHTLLAVNALAQHLKFPLGPVKVPAGFALEAMAHREVRNWKKQHGGEVIYIRPNEEISNMAKDFKSIFDVRLAKDVYAMAREQMADLLDNPQESPRMIRMQQKLVALIEQLSALDAAA